MSLLLLSVKSQSVEDFNKAVDEALRPLLRAPRVYRLVSWLARWTRIPNEHADVLLEKLKVEAEDFQKAAAIIFITGGCGNTKAGPTISPYVQEKLDDVANSWRQLGAELTLRELLFEQGRRSSNIILECLSPKAMQGGSLKPEWEALTQIRDSTKARTKLGSALKSLLNPKNMDTLFDELDNTSSVQDKSVYDLAFWILLTELLSTDKKYWQPLAQQSLMSPACAILNVLPEWRDFTEAFKEKTESRDWLMERRQLLQTALEIDLFTGNRAANIGTAIDNAELNRIAQVVEDLDPFVDGFTPYVMNSATLTTTKWSTRVKQVRRRWPTFEEEIDVFEKQLGRMLKIAELKSRIIAMWEVVKQTGCYIDDAW